MRDAAGAKQLRETTDEHRKTLWRQIEREAGTPWFLGERRSALDLYVAVMTRWRPGRAWFAENTPKVMAIAERAAKLPGVNEALRRNFE